MLLDHHRASVIIPAYNEVGNVIALRRELAPVCDELGGEWEFIFVDDGSTDDTFEALARVRAEDRRVKVIRLSRNFGSHPAISAGLAHARGDFAIVIAADLQDPPGCIPEMVKRWLDGWHVVWGVRESRSDPWLKRALSALFYGVFLRMALPSYPRTGTSGFSLIDRKVVEVIKGHSERNRFVFGLVAEAGFRQTMLHYAGRPRAAGVSKWNLGRLLKLAIDAFVSFTFLPIRFIAYLGLFFAVAGFLYGTYVLIARLWFEVGETATGWASVIVAVVFLGGIQLVMLGILGEYLWRIGEDTKGRPLYIVMERLGLDEEAGRREEGGRRKEEEGSRKEEGGSGKGAVRSGKGEMGKDKQGGDFRAFFLCAPP